MEIKQVLVSVLFCVKKFCYCCCCLHIKGETTIVMPGSTSAGTWKQRLFPPPVGIKTKQSLWARAWNITSFCPGLNDFRPKDFSRTSCIFPPYAFCASSTVVISSLNWFCVSHFPFPVLLLSEPSKTVGRGRKNLSIMGLSFLFLFLF